MKIFWFRWKSSQVYISIPFSSIISLHRTGTASPTILALRFTKSFGHFGHEIFPSHGLGIDLCVNEHLFVSSVEKLLIVFMNFGSFNFFDEDFQFGRILYLKKLGLEKSRKIFCIRSYSFQFTRIQNFGGFLEISNLECSSSKDTNPKNDSFALSDSSRSNWLFEKLLISNFR